MKGALCIVVAAALTCLAAQEPDAAGVLEGTAAAAKSYLRDTTELPLRVATTTREYDAAGKLRGTRRDSHRFAIVQARPDEYKAHGDFSAMTWLFHHGSFVDQMDSDMTAVAAGMLLRPDIRPNFEFKISSSDPEPGFRVRYQSSHACSFEITGRRLKLSNWCGSGEYIVDPGSYALQRFTFEAAGTPLLEGRKLRGYRVEETFQSVSVPGVAKPLVVPRTITATYEGENGKTVLTSDFTLLSSPSK